MTTRLFYGWIVVGAAFTCMLVIFGSAYSFAAFFESFTQEFSAQRADVALVFGLSGLLYFILGAPAGALADRFGPRATCTAGMIVLAAGLYAASHADSLMAVYLAYGVGVGLGVGLVYTPAMGAVLPWFARRRGLASGIASSGIGAGTLLVPVAAAALIAATDWRTGMRTLAIVAALLGLAAASLMEKNPARRGLGPDGGPASDASRNSAHSAMSGASLGQALGSRRFWWLYLSIFACAPTMFTPFAHVAVHAQDLGIPAARAVSLVGLIGIGSLVGRFGIGALADWLGRLPTLVIMETLLAATYLLWWSAAGYPAMVVFALSFGLCYGGIVSLLPPICMDLFGGRAVSGVIGVQYSAAAMGNLVGPVAAGAAFDHY
ncbi:MAG: MFS transporter, partial [Quisquiliibacterium sp.]